MPRFRFPEPRRVQERMREMCPFLSTVELDSVYRSFYELHTLHRVGDIIEQAERCATHYPVDVRAASIHNPPESIGELLWETLVEQSRTILWSRYGGGGLSGWDDENLESSLIVWLGNFDLNRDQMLQAAAAISNLTGLALRNEPLTQAIDATQGRARYVIDDILIEEEPDDEEHEDDDDSSEEEESVEITPQVARALDSELQF